MPPKKSNHNYHRVQYQQQQIDSQQTAMQQTVHAMQQLQQQRLYEPLLRRVDIRRPTDVRRQQQDNLYQQASLVGGAGEQLLMNIAELHDDIRKKTSELAHTLRLGDDELYELAPPSVPLSAAAQLLQPYTSKTSTLGERGSGSVDNDFYDNDVILAGTTTITATAAAAVPTVTGMGLSRVAEAAAGGVTGTTNAQLKLLQQPITLPLSSLPSSRQQSQQQIQQPPHQRAVTAGSQQSQKQHTKSKYSGNNASGSGHETVESLSARR